MLVDCRGLESALEAVRVSVEAVRVSIEALRCLRGCERLEEVPENVSRGRESVAEAKKVPVEVVREPVRKSVLKNSGTHQNVLDSFRSLASISERLCFRFNECPNPDPDPPSRIRIH